MKIKQLFNTTKMAVKKNSPAILTTVGVVGLGVTAYLAYKSREKVELVVADIEEKRANEEEVDNLEVAKGIAEAVYLPVLVGTASVVAILASYRIQSRRVSTLASALLAQQTHNAFIEKKYKETHGEEAYSKFMAPVTQEINEEVDAKGRVKKTATDIKNEIDKSVGQWYSDSLEYVSDDHTYNMAFIDSVEEKLQTILFQRGSLLLNEVLDALGFERIRAGALLGWTTADSFNLEKHVVNVNNEGEQIWVRWARPRYIYDEVEFNGRYAVNAL